MTFSREFTTLTEAQQDKAETLAREVFVKVETEDYNHFEFLGTRCDRKTFNLVAGFEVHTEDEQSFLLELFLNEKNRGLKKQFKLTNL
jgi:hypothetical protein